VRATVAPPAQASNVLAATESLIQRMSALAVVGAPLVGALQNEFTG
jgi:hypothetical protein